jgi:hypothetical protein
MRAQLLWALAALAPLAAGASEPLGKHRASLESVELLRQSSFPALAVGDFVVAPTAGGDMHSVTFRFHTRAPANGESLASYLKASLVTELRAAGKYDSAAATAITGELSESRLQGGSAVLAARILVVRSGRRIYDKLLREQSRWDSSALGEVAIPDAFNHYTELYGKLIVQLFQDDAFKAAIAP